MPNVKFYVDGSQQGSTQSKTYTSIYDSTTAFQIGTINHGGTPSQWFDGKIDEVRLWNTARSSTDINNNYNKELTGSESGLAAYYPFEFYGPAFSLADKTSNGNTLTNNGTTDLVSGTPFTNSSHFIHATASSHQYLYAPDSASLSITGSMTAEAWVNFDSLPASGQEMIILSKYRDDNNQISWGFTLKNNSGTYQLRYLTSTNGSNWEASTVNWTPSTGTWYHVAMVYDSTAPNVSFYVNGSQLGTTQTKTHTSLYDSTTAFQIGTINQGGTPSQWFDGKIDEVRLWNVARTGTQINNNKSIELNGNETGLVAYYPLEDL